MVDSRDNHQIDIYIIYTGTYLPNHSRFPLYLCYLYEIPIRNKKIEK